MSESINGKSIWWRICLILPFALCLTSCDEKEKKASGPEQVIVVGSQWYGHLPVFVGMEKGFFSKAGFEVEFRAIGKSMDRLNAISSGDAQFASLGEIAMLSAMSRGNNRFYWVGNQDIAPGFEGLVGRPGIASFEDLKGKTIGFPFGSSVDITARLLLKENGLVAGTDVNLVNLETGDVPAVFRAGRVDAALVWEPGFSQLTEVEGATVLGMDTDTSIYKEFGTMTGPDVLVISKSWVDSDPDRARRFMDAYFESVSWTSENTEAAVDLAVAGSHIQQEKPVLMKNIGKFVWHGKADQAKVMSETGIFAQADTVLKVLKDDMKVITDIPDFRKQVNWELMGMKPPTAN